MIQPGLSQRVRAAIAFARKTFYDDGAEGETVHLLCGELEACLDALEGRFTVAKNLAHPFVGPTPKDKWTVWCVECRRDSGSHHFGCSKSIPSGALPAPQLAAAVKAANTFLETDDMDLEALVRLVVDAIREPVAETMPGNADRPAG